MQLQLNLDSYAIHMCRPISKVVGRHWPACSLEVECGCGCVRVRPGVLPESSPHPYHLRCWGLPVEVDVAAVSAVSDCDCDGLVVTVSTGLFRLRFYAAC